MAQPGSALVWGTRGRRIEACCPDQHTPARAERSPAYGIAWVAQMVERRFEEPGVRGSIPLPRTKLCRPGRVAAAAFVRTSIDVRWVRSPRACSRGRPRQPTTHGAVARARGLGWPPQPAPASSVSWQPVSLQGCSSAGRVSVSKTEGRGFEPRRPCQERPRPRAGHAGP